MRGDSRPVPMPMARQDSQRITAAPSSPPREPTPPRTVTPPPREPTPPRTVTPPPRTREPTPPTVTPEARPAARDASGPVRARAPSEPVPTVRELTPTLPRASTSRELAIISPTRETDSGLVSSPRDTDPAVVPAPRPDTVELELDAWDDDDPVAEPPPPGEPSLDPEARAVIATCEAELATSPEALRAARLHYEIARAYEETSGFLEQAADHYQRALAGAPEYVPAIRGARRTLIERAQLEGALPLFDAEEKLTSSPKRKAMLHYRKGRLIEDRLDDAGRARASYGKALELDPTNASILKAIEQCDRKATHVEALLGTLEKTANAIVDDARHRAALMVERAKLVERRGEGPGPSAAEVYEAALKLDPHALGALEALERIYRREQSWRGLSASLEREARQTNDEGRRALALYHIARIHDERLGNRAEAVSALVKAAAATPSDPLVLEELARYYEQAEEHDRLAEVLAALIRLAGDQRERVALLHRLAQVFEGPLKSPDAAIERYREALAIEPTFLPVLQALGRLLAARNQWPLLVEMHLAEAAATGVPARAAAAHARVAEVFETHLRDPAEAATHHARALTLVPGYPSSFKALTRLYAQLDRPRELVELLERGVEHAQLASLKIAYLMKVGSIWEDALADPVQALHAFRRILELDDANLVALHAVQRVAERAERYQQLVEALEREVELVDDRALRVGLLHRVGTVFDEHLKDQDAALSRFRRALELDPAFVPGLASVGRIYYRAGRWADLLDVYAREVKVTTGDEAVALMHRMGELCEQKLGDVPMAIAWYQRAIELDPTYRPAMRALTRRLRERGEWSELARVLELEVARLEDPAARALGWFRIGQVHEDWLDDPKAAIKAYQSALAQRPGYRPARTALARLFSEQREWMPLIETLTQEATATDDAVHAASALMRQAEVYRDEIADPALATLCLEAVAEHEVGAIPALLALEPLYAQAGAWDKLAVTFAALADKLADPGARVAALRELARLQESRVPRSARSRTQTYDGILAIQRDDEAALVALERLGRGNRDDRILASVYARLSETADDPNLAAAFFTELGRALERLGDRHALEAYRAAVKKDAGVLTAIRGLARVADLRGDARAMAQAARLEAELTRKPEIAAKLFVRAGILRREQMNDLGAVEDFERALEVWPDDTQGAERIIQPLLETGQVVRLIDILSKTATSAKSTERKTALWLEVGGLYTRKFDNLGAAITAFKRALDATPGHVTALSRLAEAYERNRQWGDAVATLEQLLTLTSDDVARAEAHLKLAAIFHEHLGKTDRASRCVEAVLRHDPKHAGALLRLADIQLKTGNEADAVTTTQRLVDLADSPKAKGAALVRVARIQRVRGDSAAADAALSEAFALEGPGGDAERELKKAIEGHGSWVGYAAGLANYIKRVTDTRDPSLRGDLATAYLELARTYADGMNLPARAIEALEQALESVDDGRLVLDLSQRLRAAGRFDEALAKIKPATSREPILPDAWNELAIVFEQGGRRDEALRVASALRLLGVADPSVRPGTPRPASAVEGTFDASAISSLAVDAVHASPATALLASIGDVVGKVYPASLERYGLAARDRVTQRSGSSTWELATRIARIVGAEFELYEHDAPEPTISVELFETPALVVSRNLRRLPVAQQVFLLSYALGPIASRVHPALSLRTAELELLLVGAARVFVPTFTWRGQLTSEIEDAKELLRKAISRKWRRNAEVAAMELASSPPADLGRWHSALTQTAVRTALLIADDLVASIEALHLVVDLPATSGPALVQSSDAIRDLMRFWISNRASTIRRNTGMVSG